MRRCMTGPHTHTHWTTHVSSGSSLCVVNGVRMIEHIDVEWMSSLHAVDWSSALSLHAHNVYQPASSLWHDVWCCCVQVSKRSVDAMAGTTESNVRVIVPQAQIPSPPPPPSSSSSPSSPWYGDSSVPLRHVHPGDYVVVQVSRQTFYVYISRSMSLSVSLCMCVCPWWSVCLCWVFVMMSVCLSVCPWWSVCLSVCVKCL